jgi:hypothetical protein
MRVPLETFIVHGERGEQAEARPRRREASTSDAEATRHSDLFQKHL